MLNTLRRQRWIPGFTILLVFWSYGLQAQQIVIDGRTQTNVAVNGNVSDVTTSTISGVNAYNSFSEFNVYQDNVVNLHLPGGTENLLNLVHDQATSIDGMLNAIRDGQIGGSVYFANPHGFVVGAGGVINVGSLSVSTPTSQFMEEFFISPGQPSSAHTDQLLNYSMPLNDTGLISIQGTVNAIGDIDLRSGTFESSGVIQSGAVYAASAPGFGDVVNLADVQSGSVLSVADGDIRIAAETDLAETGTLASKGGDVALAGRNITVDGGALVTAAADTTAPAGNVTITASHVLGTDDEASGGASSSVLIGPATVRGHDIAVSATASNARDAEGSTVENELLGALKLIDLNAFEAGGLQAGSVRSSATATVGVGAGANLFADHDVTLTSSADSEARISVLELAGVLLPVGVGGAYAGSDAKAETRVGAGSTISAGNLLRVDAEAANAVEVASRGLGRGTVLLSVAEASTDSDARIEHGADVAARSVDIDAVSTSDIQNSTGPITLVGANAGGISATYLRSNADAEMDANADLAGDLDVDALSTTTRNTTIAKSKLKSGIESDKVTRLRKLFSATAKAVKVPGGASSAFAIGDSEHVANASIGANADIDAANVHLAADTVDNFKLISEAEAETSDFALGSAASVGSYGNTANAFVGENASVDADDQLTVDANTAVPSPVDPEVLFFWQADNFFEGVQEFLGIVADVTGSIAEAFLTSGSIAKATSEEGTGIAGMHTGIDVDNDANAYIANGARVNTDQSSAAVGQTVSVTAGNEIDAVNLAGGLGGGNTLGGAVNDLQFDVDVKAAIADGAIVNARQDLNVDSSSTENLVNIAVAGGKAAKFGLVGSVNLIDADNNVQALVDDQANTHAGRDTNVTADDTANSISVSGGVVKGGSTGIGFSWAVNRLTSIVRAFFGNDADALAPGSGDAGRMTADNSVNIRADSTQNLDSWSLAASAGGPGTGDVKSTAKGSAGFGASGDVSLNTVDGETAAFIDSGVDVDADFVLDVNAANTAQLNARSGSASIQSGASSSGIAGSYSENGVRTAVRAFIDDATILRRPDDTYTVVRLGATSDGGISSIAIGGGGSGKVGVAGSVAVNEIGADDPDQADTEAYIRGATLERADVEVGATDRRGIGSLTGALSVSGTAGIGPSVSINNISNDTRAFLENSVIEQANSVDVAALNDNAIRSISASAGIGTTSFGGAGSLSHNTIDNSTEAYAKDTQIDEAINDVAVSAGDTSFIRSIAGGGAFGSSIGVGISAAYNDIANRIRAYFDNASVTTGGSVLVTADSDGQIETVGVGIGASGSTGLAGSVSVNKLRNDIAAEIGNGSTVSADQNVKVAAGNRNDLLVVAGSASGGGTAGGGGAVVVNIVDNDTSARVTDSDVDADANGEGVVAYSGDANDADDDADATELVKGLVVDAYSREDITSANGNGAGGGTAGVAASTSVSTIKDTTTAAITGSNINRSVSVVDDASADQQVRIAAYERVAFGGGSGNGAGGGSAGVGVGVDATVVQNSTQAYVDEGSNVHANRAIDVAAAHREDVLSASVGGAGGGAAGVVGSGNGARMASTTRAYVANSTASSDGSIGVRATEKADLVQIAGGVAGGGAVGGTGAVGVAVLENTTEAYLGNGAVTNADTATDIQASSNESIDHYVISASGGGTVGVAANISVKSAKSATRAFIDGGATVNQEQRTDATEQDVSVEAESDLAVVGATGGASGAGVVGGGAAVDLDFVKNTTTAYIGDGASVTANRDVSVQADAHRDVTSFAVGGGGGGTVGVSGMVSVINIGARLDDDSRAEVGNAGGYADDQVSGDNTQGIDANDTFAANSAAEAAGDNSGTTVSSDVTETSTEAMNRTTALLGDLATVNAGRDVRVQATDRTEVEQNVGGIAVSLGGSVGGSVGIVNTNTYNQALIGAGAQVDSGGLVQVEATMDNDTRSAAIAGAGGLVGLGAAVAIVNDDSVTLAEIEDDAAIDRAGQVTVQADADVDLDTAAIGTTAGAGAVGASVARSNSTSITRAQLADGVMIGQNQGLVGSLNVGAVSDVDADAHAVAGSAGIVSGSGADARSRIDGTTDAGIGQYGNIDVAGDIDVTARGLTQGEARADGVNVAGLTVGISQARADASPRVLASIGDQSQLASGGDIRLTAAHNTDELGAELAGRKMHARAFSAAGALLGGVGSDARASVSPDVDARVGPGVEIDAGNQAVVGATTVARAEADASGQAYGAAARGVTGSEALVDAHTNVTMGMDSVIAGLDVLLSAVSNLFADSDTVGGNGGALSIGGTTSRARLDNVTGVGVGANSRLSADRDVLVEAVTSLDANSFASVGAGGAVTINQVSADTDIVNDTSVDIGAGATLSAAEVTVRAVVDKLKGFAEAASTTYAGGSDSQANSYVDVESNVDAIVRGGAELRGQQAVNVVARTSGVDIDSIADAKIGGGITGNLLAIAHGDLNADSDVDVQEDAIITSPNISLLAETVSNDGDFNRSADAEANTVVNWVLERSTTLVRKAEKIPFIGWFFKWIRKTVFTWVADVLQSDVSARITGGTPRTDNGIQMNGTLAQLSALSPRLVVNADRTIDSDGNIAAEVIGDEVVVNGVNNNVVGTIDISSPGGVVSGAGTLLLNKTFDTVDITNNSDLDMRINNIDVLAANAEDPELNINADQDLTTFNVVSEVDVSDVNVLGNTPADIIIAGDISNPAGITRITNTGGAIYGDGGSIESNSISLAAHNGDIGQAGNLIRLELIRDFDDAELTVLAGGSAYLDVRLAEYLDEVPAAGHVVDGLAFQEMTAGQNLVLNLRSGVIYDLPDQPGLEPVPVAALARYHAGEIVAGGDMAITEAPLADFDYQLLRSTDGSVALDLGHESAWISRIEAANGGVSVSSAGSIENGSLDGSANFVALDVDLDASDGIGSAEAPLEIDQGASGTLNVTAGGDVHLGSGSGGFGIGLIDAVGNLVSMVVNGSILSRNDDESENIIAETVSLQSAGAVGATDRRLVVDSGDGAAARVDISAVGDVDVDERAGDLRSNVLTSTDGSVDLLIRDGNGDLASVSAQDITLRAAADGASLHVGNADAADSVTLSGDLVTVDRLLDSNDGGLKISVSGNDGGLAQDVSMRIETTGSLLFDAFKSVYSNLWAFSNDITFEQLIVGELFSLENDALRLTLDYKDSKDNENSDVLETRDQPIHLTVEGTRIDADDAENLFVIKEKL